MPGTSTAERAPPRLALSFALWGMAMVDGRTSLDEAAAVIAGGRQHRLTGVPGEPGPVNLTVALGRLWAAGARAFGLALPVPGDPLGVSGPRAYTEAAVASGQVVVVPHLRLALVTGAAQGEHGSAVQWSAWSGLPDRPPAETVAAAARSLREAVLEAAEVLAELDAPVTPGSEPAEPRIPLAVPPGLDQRTVDLIDRADALLAAVSAALSDRMVTTSAGLDTRRRNALVPVERAARRALVAACQPALADLRRP